MADRHSQLMTNAKLDSDGNQVWTELEKELDEHATWKTTQKNTFTNWVNMKLASIDELNTDFSDGTKLIRLVEILSQKKVGKYHKKPQFRSHLLENVSLALDFLEHTEKIRLVNIDSSHIVDQNLKLILGLVWTLILHYEIAMPVWDDQSMTNGRAAAAKQTPKQRLMSWITVKLPAEYKIKNFTTDWNDGIALGALVDSCAPGLNPDWPDWKSNEKLKNVNSAMDLAEKWLDVPKLMQPEEIVDPKIDELSMMTYLSQYPTAKAKPDAPLRPRKQQQPTHQHRRQSQSPQKQHQPIVPVETQSVYASPPQSARAPRASPVTGRAYGQGVQTRGGVQSGRPATFVVELRGGGDRRAELDVMFNSEGNRVTSEAVYDPTNRTYTINYSTPFDGLHNIHVQLDEQNVEGSPFTVNVAGTPADPSKVKVNGPGLEPGVIQGRSTWFNVDYSGAGPGELETVILGSDNSKTVHPQLSPAVGGAQRIEYCPHEEGLHSINIFYAGKPITGSPFGVRVKPASEPSRVLTWGRGLQNKGVRINDTTCNFVVDTANAGSGELAVGVKGPDGKLLNHEERVLNAESTMFRYAPTRPGTYEVHVLFADEHVHVAEPSKCKIRAFGPGLEGGIARLPADFTVEMNGDTSRLEFSIDGPSKAHITPRDNGDGTAEVSYEPQSEGIYIVHVLADDHDIKDSPFVVQMKPFTGDVQPSFVRCTGAGVNTSETLKRTVPTTFSVDCSQAGQGELGITAFDNVAYEPLHIEVNERGDGKFECFYTPYQSCKHTIFVSYGGVSVPGSPFKMRVEEPIDPSKVRIFGPAVEGDARSTHLTEATIDCKQAGAADLSVQLTNEDNAPIELNVANHNDHTYTLSFTPPAPGTYHLNVLYDHTQVPNMPLKINVRPHLDVQPIKMHDVYLTAYVNAVSSFSVDARPVSMAGGSNSVTAHVIGPRNDKQNARVTDKADGTYQVEFTPAEIGTHHVYVYYESIELQDSPLAIFVQSGADGSRVNAYGAGLESALVKTPAEFIVDTKSAGQGALSIEIVGPCQAETECLDNGDGTCTVRYVAVEQGEYKINVTFADQPINNSPFTAFVSLPVDSRAVKASGNGLEASKIREQEKMTFLVDASHSGKSTLDVQILDDDGRPIETAKVNDRPNNCFLVEYTAPKASEKFEIHVKYDEKHVQNSPYRLRSLPSVESRKVRVDSQQLDGHVLASLPVNFLVDARNAGKAKLDILVTDRNGDLVAVKVEDLGDSRYECEFIAAEPGRYLIEIRYGGESITARPHTCEATVTGDASKCDIVEQPDCLFVGTEACISVDARHAGKGAVTARVTSKLRPNDPPLKSDVRDNKDGTFTAYFTPTALEPLLIQLKFGGQSIPQGEISMMPEPAESYRAATYQKTQSSRSFGEQTAPVEYWNFQQTDVSDNNSLEAHIELPDGGKDAPNLTENKDGSVTVSYQPMQVGSHKLHIKCNRKHLNGSPFTFFVDGVSTAHIGAFGPGLVYGNVGEPAAFTVSGKGRLSLSVEGPAKAEIKCHDNRDGTCTVTWIPPLAGEYKVHVKFDGQPIHESPFTVHIAGKIPRRHSQLSVGLASEVSLKMLEPDTKDLVASIRAPSGQEEPCYVSRLIGEDLSVVFTPKEIGEHLVSVKRRGMHIANSPFSVNVTRDQVGNSEAVQCTGEGLSRAQTQQFNEFIIDTTAAGYANLTISLEGPKRAQLVSEKLNDGRVKIKYMPVEPGIYLLNVRFGDENVPGAPFTINVQGSSEGMQSERLEKAKQKASTVTAGQDTEFFVRLPGCHERDIKASVKGPSGRVEPIDIKPIGNDIFELRMQPKEDGLHIISVFLEKDHVAGSPFSFTVGQLHDFGAHRVRASGSGLTRGEIQNTNSFNIYSREAGPGILTVAVEGPSKAQLKYHDVKDSNGYVDWKVSKPGEYVIRISFDGKDIPGSPFTAVVSPGKDVLDRVKLHSLPREPVPVDKPIVFTVKRDKVFGQLNVRVTSPHGTSEHLGLTPVDGHNRDYLVARFVPRQLGTYSIAMTLDDVPLPNSPFHVRVIGHTDTDPGAVFVTGLKSSRVGESGEFIVDTSAAGEGTLSIKAEGPSKVDLSTDEVDDGKRITYQVHSSGEYTFHISYNNQPIPNSPFKVIVAGKHGSPVTQARHSTQTEAAVPNGVQAKQYKGDAQQVRCVGQGLSQQVHLGRTNTFTIDCRNAGTDILYVGAMAPHGPIDELTVRHERDGLFEVSYSVHEPGNTFIHVRYGDRHVPGSPFMVTL